MEIRYFVLKCLIGFLTFCREHLNSHRQKLTDRSCKNESDLFVFLWVIVYSDQIFSWLAFVDVIVAHIATPIWHDDTRKRFASVNESPFLIYSFVVLCRCLLTATLWVNSFIGIEKCRFLMRSDEYWLNASFWEVSRAHFYFTPLTDWWLFKK